jgi:hypothetical protein
MKATACIQEPGGGQDLVQVLDISRGGISFRGTRAYEVNSWINFAVPLYARLCQYFCRRAHRMEKRVRKL